MDREELERILEEHKGWLCWKPNCRKANLRGSDLREADLRGANLSGVTLICADLSGADLRGADLIGAPLSWANLSGANLRGAVLREADLRGADLRRSDLSGADLRGANLRGVMTSEVEGKTIISVQVNTSRPNNLIRYWKELDIVTTGCFQGTLEELKKEVDVTHKDNKYLRERYHRAIAFIEKEIEAEEEIEE